MREDKAAVRQRARELRRTMTPAERLLWSHLRGHRLGFPFRRQAPIGQVIVDFACLSQRVVVEVDGRHHLGDPQDRERDRWLAARGFRVLRFQNQEVLGDVEAVLKRIQMVLTS
jgi:very-short-patch-repair endonuclease